MTRRKLIICVLLFLLLGAIINVAVAWGCAAWVNALEHGTGIQARLADPNLPGQRHWFVTRRTAFGATRILVMTNDRTPNGVNDEGSLFPTWSNLRTTMRQRLEEANALPRPADTMNHPRPVALVDDARGWPFRALMCHWDHGMTAGAPPAQRPLHGGIAMTMFGGRPTGALDYARALPCRPIWPGFAINTIFYAAILWGGLWIIFAVPGMVKRRMRNIRGRCVHCGYDLRGQPLDSKNCPECGRSS